MVGVGVVSPGAAAPVEAAGPPVVTRAGTGVEGVADDPSIMFRAHVACTGCHRPPFPGATAPATGSTFAADPLACIDCHGPGYDGMLENWQSEFRATAPLIQKSLQELHGKLGDSRSAKRHYAAAAEALSLALADRRCSTASPCPNV